MDVNDIGAKLVAYESRVQWVFKRSDKDKGSRLVQFGSSMLSLPDDILPFIKSVYEAFPDKDNVIEYPNLPVPLIGGKRPHKLSPPIKARKDRDYPRAPEDPFARLVWKYWFEIEMPTNINAKGKYAHDITIWWGNGLEMSFVAYNAKREAVPVYTIDRADIDSVIESFKGSELISQIMSNFK